ncbi:MAG: Na/Pi cotransporter family protein [Kiritimatiellae bacterium]|nr:Na/Pi cotransporter family protein [Kiritimatiellia bacterium]MDW8458176.1 Na/Pi cotransporter family protein [Verrucomicrobiota bacterium]
MDADSLALTLLRVGGGLALFLFSIQWMTEGLQKSASRTLRNLVRRATRGRWVGAALGIVLGFLLHSSATTVMVVGFLNAGLLTLSQAIGPIVGANIGTTLSMQLISFKVGHYFFIPILFGAIIHFGLRRPPWNALGQAIAAFGLLFLSMNLMSEAVSPHREAIRPLVAAPQGSGFFGQLAALAAAASATAVIQSSGAMIGMIFALIDAGVFSSLETVFPLVLGAHIGTCSTALLGSIGTSVEAKRGAVAHLLFNLVGSALALVAEPLLIPLICASSSDLVRQTANLHTAVMVMTAVAVLPMRRPFVWLVCKLMPSRSPPQAGSYLEDEAIAKPEQAIYLAIRELQRVAALCEHTFRLNAEIMFRLNPRTLRTIRRNEEAVDEIQTALKDYLRRLTTRYLSRRQAIMIQHLNRCMVDIERIGDHNENIADLTEQRLKTRGAAFPREAQQALFELFEQADHILLLVIRSLDPDQKDFQGMAHQILIARDSYAERSLSAKALLNEKIINHEWAPIAGMFLSEYIAEFDRIVRHAKMIALVESHPYFWIKRRKLEKVAPELPEPPPAHQEPKDFLDQLHAEGFL